MKGPIFTENEELDVRAFRSELNELLKKIEHIEEHRILDDEEDD